MQIIYSLVERYKMQQSTGLIAFALLEKFLAQPASSFSSDKQKRLANQKSSKNLSTADHSGSSSSRGSALLDKELDLFAKVCLLIAGKFNEIHWPGLSTLFPSMTSMEFSMLEAAVLRPLGFKVPFPNHYFYLELLFSLLGLGKEAEQQIRKQLIQQLGKPNFFALCPKTVAVFLVSKVCTSNREWARL